MMFRTFERDRSFLENKYHWQNEPFDPYRRMAYHGYDYPTETGLSDEEILSGLEALDRETAHLPHAVAKAEAIRYVLSHTRIDVNEQDYFIGIYSWNRLIKHTTLLKWKNEIFEKECPETNARMKDMNASGAVAIWPDFDHVVPDWSSIMKLGFRGIRDRARNYRRIHEENGTLTDKVAAHFDGIEIEYSAILSLLGRLCAV